MKLNYTLRCPECKFIIDISISSPNRTGYSYYICKRCGKKIKFNLDQDSGPYNTDNLKSSKVSHLTLFEHPYRIEQQIKPPEQSPAEGEFGALESSPISKDRMITTDTPAVPALMTKTLPKKKARFIGNVNNRLKLASIFLVLVFLFGLIHGINTLILGTTEFISIDQSKPETSDISGSIRDNRTGRPIRNCKVSILETGESTVTNSDGQYFVADVKAGVHQIRAEADGYIVLNKRVTIDPELMGVINFELDMGVGSRTVDESVELISGDEGGDLNLFAILFIIFACLALVASLLAYKQLFFPICAFSSFISVLSIGFGVGIILGILAFILIALSSSAFKRAPTNKNKPIKKKPEKMREGKPQLKPKPGNLKSYKHN